VEKLTKTLESAKSKGIIAGSVGNDYDNYTLKVCNDIRVWQAIIPTATEELLKCRHILNSWFVLSKNDSNKTFIDEWCFYVLHKTEQLKFPLATYHHTIDQSIFNILAVKNNFHVFRKEGIGHDDNKDRNVALREINRADNVDELFVRILDTKS
jgi:hypothetical protein